MDVNYHTLLSAVVAGTEATMHWRVTALEEVGISGPILFSHTPAGIPDTPIHRIAYLYLRQAISHYKAQGGFLQLSSKPSGALNWQPPEAQKIVEGRGISFVAMGDQKLIHRFSCFSLT